MSRAKQGLGVAYYDRDAETFAKRYNSVTFEAVHEAIADFLPALPALILDVGAGSGRDARALAQRGYRVTAVEPSAALRAQAQSYDDAIAWVDDRLPELTTVVATEQRYDFILCSAVLMLLAGHELASAIRTMAALLSDHGHLAVSVRDPVDGEPRDVFHTHETADILAAASSARLVTVHQQDVSDALGRNPHHWRSFVFARVASDQPPGSGSPLPRNSS